MIKLTKNEFRYSIHVKPEVNQTVEFLPVTILNGPQHWLTKPTTTVFINNYMVFGTKCKVIKNSKYITYVHFTNDEDVNSIDMVSPCYLMSRDLTDKAFAILQFLRNKLNRRK